MRSNLRHSRVEHGKRELGFRGYSMTKRKSKRVRGPGRPIIERIAEGFDRILLDIIKNGQAVEDVNGRLVRQTPSAAMMAVVFKRLKDTKHDRSKSSPTQALHDEAVRRGLAYPGDGLVGSIGPRG